MPSLPTPTKIDRYDTRGNPVYILVYNTATKKIMGLNYGEFVETINTSINSVIVEATYAAVQSQASTAGLADIPPKPDNAP